jgi:hypothetical protein
MVMSNAERQARWRRNHLRADGDRVRLQLCIDTEAYDRLVRLGAYYQRTAAELFEQLMASAERHVEGRLSGQALAQYRAAGDDDAA